MEPFPRWRSKFVQVFTSEVVNPYSEFVTDAVTVCEIDVFMEFSVLALACILGKFWDFMPINRSVLDSFLVHFRPCTSVFVHCISQYMGSN